MNFLKDNAVSFDGKKYRMAPVKYDNEFYYCTPIRSRMVTYVILRMPIRLELLSSLVQKEFEMLLRSSWTTKYLNLLLQLKEVKPQLVLTIVTIISIWSELSPFL